MSGAYPEIVLKEIRKTYCMGEVNVPVLLGIDLEIRSGEITVIHGASGSGKSTLLNIIGGIDRPSSGTVTLDQCDITKYSDSELTEFRRDNIGFVFQFYNLVATLTAKENIEVVTELSPDSMAPMEALKLVGLEQRAHSFPAQLSGGEQQRIAIARALVKKPRLILCDEPTGALDAKTSSMVLKTLIDLNREQGITLVIITHDLPIVKMGHQVAHIGNGVIDELYRNETPLSYVEDA